MFINFTSIGLNDPLRLTHNATLMTNRNFILALGTLVSIASANAQETVTTSGAEASGSGGSASYTVGQVVYNTNSGGSNSVAEGVQQPYEISTVTSVEEADDIVLTVFPNPSADHIYLNSERIRTGMRFELYDLHGKLVKTEAVSATQTLIDLSQLASASYVLKITQGQTELKSFRIQKN